MKPGVKWQVGATLKGLNGMVEGRRARGAGDASVARVDSTPSGLACTSVNPAFHAGLFTFNPFGIGDMSGV